MQPRYLRNGVRSCNFLVGARCSRGMGVDVSAWEGFIGGFRRWKMEVGARDMGGQGLSSRKAMRDFSEGRTMYGAVHRH